MVDGKQSSTNAQAGRNVEEFAHQAGLSRSGLYDVPLEHWPHFLRFGRRIILTEAPKAWLRRMTRLGGIPSKRRAAA